MDALETFLRPVARLINRQIAMKTPARELCEQLDGRVIAVRVRDSGLAMYFFIDPAGVGLSGDFDGEPDVVVSGSLLKLAAMAGQSGENAVRDGSIDVTGDAEVAQSFQRLLRHARPDMEEELSNLVGDVAAHGLGELVRSLGDWGRQAGSTLQQNLGEYLQEESRALPSRYEAGRFRREV
ncbi:MAG TPA: SCP2 sterol-binding domain-containing protein, partial [Woeseiaceae bacterium]